MRRVYGWDHREEYGWFMSAAIVPLSLALIALITVHALVARYEARLATRAIGTPAPSATFAVVGASIGDVPDDASLAALRTELGPNLPWSRVLIRTNRGNNPLAIQSLFFPFNSAAEAMGFCRGVAATAPACATIIAPSSDLSTADHKPATAAVLARLNIAPYSGAGMPLEPRIVIVPRTVVVREPAPPAKTIVVQAPAPPAKTVVVQAPPKIIYIPGPAKTVVLAAPPPKIVYLPTPAAKPQPAPAPAPAAPPTPTALNVQPPLKLQPGVGTVAVHYDEQPIWFSKQYQPGDQRLTDIVGAGDVMMGSISQGLNPALRPGVDVATLVGADLASIFRHADVAFVNLEGPLYEGSEGTGKSCAQCFAFHGPTFYAGILKSFGIDVVSLANNHSGDYGEAGRNSTMAALRANGIAYGGLDRDDARTGEMILPNGRKVGFIAFAPNTGTLNINDLTRAAQLVRDLKKTHDLVMVSFHGGGEGWTYVHVKPGNETFVGENRGDVTAFAHTVIDAGADIVIGQGPHVPRAMEVYKGHLIAYSLGNFWTYNGVQTYAVSGLGPVLEAWVAPDGGIAGFVIHSTRQAGLGVPHLDPLDEAARYMLYLTRSDFPATAALIAGHKQVASNGSM
jgi:poly-gamma-glutamate capsule biosynthesis protein CapA/YwtB (metallophosphatase superfamily)